MIKLFGKKHDQYDDDFYMEDDEMVEDDEFYEDDETMYADEEEDAEDGDYEDTYEDDDTVYAEDEDYEEDDAAYADDETYGEEYGEDDDVEYADDEAYEDDYEDSDAAAYADDESYDEEYDDEYDDDLEYEDDEFYEDDEYDDDRRRGPFAGIAASIGRTVQKIIKKIGSMFRSDRIIAVTGVAIMVLAVTVGVVFVGSRSEAAQVSSFAALGENLQGVNIIGESGLLAVTDATRAKTEALAEAQETEESEEPVGDVTVKMNLSSIMSDIKIKFSNDESGKLIPNVPFEVDVTGPDKKTTTYTDDDMDGVIYKKDIKAGKYTVAMKAISGHDEYIISTDSQDITVKDTIEYKKVDVADEVKTEAQVNVAKEDTAVVDTAVESVLKDTVEWVESTRKANGSEEGYETVSKSSVTDPSTTARARDVYGFYKLTGTEGTPDTGSSEGGSEGEGGGNGEGGDGGGSPATVSVSEVKLSSSSLSLSVGDSEGLSVTVEPSDASNKDVNWSSSNDSVASVSGGSVTAKSAGEATITATAADGSGKSASCTVTVSNKTIAVSGISLNKSSLSLKKGSSETLTATISPSDASDKGISWESSNTSIATVSDGKVTAVAKGTATITAKAKGDSGKTATCSVTVEEVENPSITLSATSGSIGVGASTTITATVKPDNLSDKTVTWTTSDAKIATVDGGKITGVAAGTATITATTKATPAGTATYKVTVTADKPTVSLSATSGTIIAGNSTTITATVKPDSLSDKTVTWKSDNEKIAKVDGGKITGVAAGTATITATTKATPVATATYKVTVKNDPKKDTTTVLKDNHGNELYIKVGNEYKLAHYADYYNYSTFYKKTNVATDYSYTGWQTIDGKTYFFDKNGNKVTGDQVIQGAKYSFDGDGALKSGSGSMGIDVSKWNGSINWSSVKNSGVSYAIIRCGYRGSTTGALIQDSKYSANINGAASAGLKVGTYFFTQAVNQVEAVEEASMVLGLVKGHKISYPIFLDVESASGGRANGLDAGTRTAVINAFCATIQNSGYTAGVYANKSWLTSKINTGSLGNYKIWLAQYAATPTYSGRYNLWQYSSKGSVSGISGNVDLNISYLGY
ncbi:MAG: Ig-like domain-containing protein [Lachnospiraceae bacterium]|nr:Ig-like domain-containing protein [Lachnospiraceae bacterium]